MPEVRRHRAGAAPREGTTLRPRGHERLGLRSAIQGTGYPSYVPFTLAHGTRVRHRQVRVGEPPRLRDREPCTLTGRRPAAPFSPFRVGCVWCRLRTSHARVENSTRT